MRRAAGPTAASSGSPVLAQYATAQRKNPRPLHNPAESHDAIGAPAHRHVERDGCSVDFTAALRGLAASRANP